MGDGEVRERPDRAHRASGRSFDLTVSKLLRPHVRTGSVRRMAAGLVEKLAVPTRRQGRVTTLERWFGWLDNWDRIQAHPMVAVLAAMIYAWMGRPVEAERWADAVDRWQYGDVARPEDISGEAWASLARALLCRRGVSRMLADAEQAARGFAAQGIVTPGPALLQGIARVLSGDLDDGDAWRDDDLSLPASGKNYPAAA